MIVSYGSKPNVMLGAFFDTIIKRNLAIINETVANAKNTMQRSQQAATIKQEQQKKTKKMLLVGGVGIIGFVFFKKIFSGKKQK
jgi:hypothetical protein